MKCVDESGETFRHVTIKITFESAEELATFSGLFGCTPVTDNMPWDYPDFYNLAQRHGVTRIPAEEMCIKLKSHPAMKRTVER